MRFHPKLNYINGNVSLGFSSLFASQTIMRVAAGFFGLFLPIFLYKLFNNNFVYVAYYYLAGYFFYALFVAWGASFLNSFGFRKALQTSAFFGALIYVTLYFTNEKNYVYLLSLNVLIVILFRISHWIPYNVDFAKFTDRRNRGKEVSLLAATINISGILTPFIAGFIIAKFGFGTLFIFGVLLYLTSYIPLITLPRTHEKFSWTYLETFQQLFSKKRRGIMLAFAADGAENVVGFIVWPIFIFNLLKGNYLQIGTISTAIIAVTVVMQLIVGKYADKKNNKERILKIGTYLYSLGWIIKIFILTAFQIFLADAYHKLMRIFTRTSFDALTFEIAADEGHFVDEFSVLHEISISLGRTLMLIIIIIASTFLSLNWTFVLAAIASLLLNSIREKVNIPSRLVPKL